MGPKEVKKQIAELFNDAVEIAKTLSDPEGDSVLFDYQRWYTRSLKVVELLAPDRIDEFRGYYEPDPKRKQLNFATYAIRDYLNNVGPLNDNFEPRARARHLLVNQMSILESLMERVDGALANLETTILAELQDSELTTARNLAKTSHRAAGALAGVVLEAHLQKVGNAHRVTVRKKHPTIADLNDALKQAAVYDTATWRKVSYLGDVRNLCSHNKDVEPSQEQVTELIDGVNWAIKLIR